MHVITIEPRQLFQSLSDLTRLRVVRLLASSKEVACLCELSQCLGEPEYKLSRHLKQLRQSGLLSAEKEGRWIYHSIPSAEIALQALFKFISKIPDSSGVFAEDLKRFQECIAARKGGRCIIAPSEIFPQKKTKKVRA